MGQVGMGQPHNRDVDHRRTTVQYETRWDIDAYGSGLEQRMNKATSTS